MAARRTKQPKCEDCFFHRHLLCALNLTEACPTFRPADRDLAPPRQMAFHLRPDRSRLLYTPPTAAQRAAFAE